MTKPTHALIAATPGRIRDSWQALLRAIPRINTIALVDDEASALHTVNNHHPGLILLEAKLINNIPDVLQQIKTGSPQTHCIVLADTFEQQWLAKNAGADSVLLAGTPAEMFFAIVEGVLSWPRKTDDTPPNNRNGTWANHNQKYRTAGANNEHYK